MSADERAAWWDLQAKAANFATARERIHREGPTTESLDALRNAESDLRESACEYVASLSAVGRAA